MIPSSDELIVRVEDGVAWLTLNRPEKRNALNASLVEQLKSALAAAEGADDVRVVALLGAGKDFCAGADLGTLERVARGPVMANLADAESLGELYLRLRQLRKPVVAVVRGRALAGGCGLATACDLVLAAESAGFGYPEVEIGFVPAMVMAILRRNISEKRAFELVALGESLSASEAERLGLINRVFPDAELDARARTLVEGLASRSASAVQLSKRLLYQQDSMGFESAIQAGAVINVIARMTEDARAGVARFTGSSAEGR